MLLIGWGSTMGAIEEAVTRLRGEGLRLLYDEPKTGTAGSRVNFIHPKSAGGVLVELGNGKNPRLTLDAYLARLRRKLREVHSAADLLRQPGLALLDIRIDRAFGPGRRQLAARRAEGIRGARPGRHRRRLDSRVPTKGRTL